MTGIDQTSDKPPPVALLFPGQGAQYQGMATTLYDREPVFTAAMDEVLDAMGAARLRQDWLDLDPGIDDVRQSTPLLYAIGYALARVVVSWGVRPTALLGHSVGELVAVTLAGTLPMSAVAQAIIERVEHLAAAPPGGMLAVAAAVTDLEPYLHPSVAVAAVNAPRQTVLAGPREPLEAVACTLRRNGFICRAVPALSPFHSPAMSPAAERGAHLFDLRQARAPELPVYSAYRGRRLTEADVVDPTYWTGQPTAPVLFWPALETLLSHGHHCLIDVGPGDGLATLARRHPATRSGSTVAALLPAGRGTGADDLLALEHARQRLSRVLTPGRSGCADQPGTGW